MQKVLLKTSWDEIIADSKSKRSKDRFRVWCHTAKGSFGQNWICQNMFVVEKYESILGRRDGRSTQKNAQADIGDCRHVSHRWNRVCNHFLVTFETNDFESKFYVRLFTLQSMVVFKGVPKSSRKLHRIQRFWSFWSFFPLAKTKILLIYLAYCWLSSNFRGP